MDGRRNILRLYWADAIIISVGNNAILYVD